LGLEFRSGYALPPFQPKNNSAQNYTEDFTLWEFSHKARYVKARGAPRKGHFASFAEIKVYGKVW